MPARINPGFLQVRHRYLFQEVARRVAAFRESHPRADLIPLGIGDVTRPLSGAVIGVNALYYGAGHWNAYFGAMIYLTDRGKFPLQLILREILNAANSSSVSAVRALGLVAAPAQTSFGP